MSLAGHKILHVHRRTYKILCRASDVVESDHLGVQITTLQALQLEGIWTTLQRLAWPLKLMRMGFCCCYVRFNIQKPALIMP